MVFQVCRKVSEECPLATKLVFEYCVYKPLALAGDQNMPSEDSIATRSLSSAETLGDLCKEDLVFVSKLDKLVGTESGDHVACHVSPILSPGYMGKAGLLHGICKGCAAVRGGSRVQQPTKDVVLPKSLAKS